MALEMKTISNCLNFIDNLIICNTEKHIGNGNLEDVRKYVLSMNDSKYIENTVSTLEVVYQIKLIIDKLCSDNESDIKQLYSDLRKRILVWLKEKNTKTEDDEDDNE